MFTHQKSSKFKNNNDNEQKYLLDWRDVSKNPAYKSFMHPMYKMQWVLHLQRNYRNKHNKKYTGSYLDPLINPVTELPVRFITETTEQNDINYSHNINNNQWLSLNFKDEEFVRNINKAFRKNYINDDRFVTAKLLYDASIAYHDCTIKQLPCDENGGIESIWSPTAVSYITPEMLEKMKNAVNSLENADNNYFIINLTRRFETVFLLDWLNRLKDSHPEDLLPKFKNLLKIFLTHKILNQSGKIEAFYNYLKKKNNFPNLPDLSNFKEFVLYQIERLNSKSIQEDNSRLLKLFGDLISLYNREPYEWLKPPFKNRDRESSYFLNIFLDVYIEQGPSYAISPDFNEHDHESPLICITFPTMALYKKIIVSFFGEHATIPYYTAGNFSPHWIKDCDDLYQARPVQITHPDLKNPLSVHDLKQVHDFHITWHDLFHCIRNSFNEHKKLLRRIRKILSDSTGFPMSKIIWELTDLDYSSYGGIFNLHLKESYAHNAPEIAAMQRARIFFDILYWIMDDKKYLNSQNLYIVLIDMISNENEWQQILNMPIDEFLNINNELFKGTKGYVNNDFGDLIIQEIEIIKSQMKTLQTNDLVTNILLRRMENNKYRYSSVMCKFLHSTKLINLIFKWSRNDGLCFNQEYSDLPIKNFTPIELYENVQKALIQLCLKKHGSTTLIIFMFATIDHTALINLVKNGFNINIKLDNGWNIVRYVAHMGTIDDVTKLLNSGIPEHIMQLLILDRHPSHGTVIHHALENKNWELASLLLNRIDLINLEASDKSLAFECAELIPNFGKHRFNYKNVLNHSFLAYTRRDSFFHLHRYIAMKENGKTIQNKSVSSDLDVDLSTAPVCRTS